MFGRIGRYVVHRPWRTIAVWIFAAVALTVLAPPLPATSNEADFLPSDYESVRAGELQERAFPGSERPAALMVFGRTDGEPLGPADRAEISEIAGALHAMEYPLVAEVTTEPQVVSPDGNLVLVPILATVQDPFDEELGRSIGKLREDAGSMLEDGPLKLGVTGDAATGLDIRESSAATDALVMLATPLLIILFLLILFRSPLIALMPVLIILVVLQVATGLIGVAAELMGMPADTSASAILIVVLFGVGTDYLLFLLFRYREQLRAGQAPRQALIRAVSRTGSTITSAAGTEIVAFAVLIFSTLGILRVMGPALAIAVAVTMAAALTLCPAVFSLLGTKAFWPSTSWRREPRSELPRRIGSLVARRPLPVALVAAGVPVLLALGVLGFRSDFDSQASLPDDLESVEAMEELREAFPSGQSDPTLIILDAGGGPALDTAALTGYEQSLRDVDGVAEVLPAEITATGDVARFTVVLDLNPTDGEAVELVSGTLRDVAVSEAPDGTEVLVGGTTAVLADIQKAIGNDYRLVFPLAGLVIMSVLALMLRGIIAPALLMLSVGLGFVATLGTTVLAFGLMGANGLTFTLPVMVYLFVIAIGTDYCILIVARLREELGRGLEPREAISGAVERSVPTVAAAAVILAGSFGILVLADNAVLRQVGFAVAFGILLSAFVIAMFLVPAAAGLLGRRMWWPRDPYGPRPDADHEPAVRPAAGTNDGESTPVPAGAG
ncbi:MMPL family transporter [Streptomyces alkaliphilus]|uniref:MMPL family transporter n=1 Tax=Streptomyces alkaliphilus TaxID=1472722 RepID=UPI00118136AD|nr:MMPL family transporter [Streptomyces alkaliphilus]MQS07751.1 MMPL family transporter [Streptomyces alkaliphilus]